MGNIDAAKALPSYVPYSGEGVAPLAPNQTDAITRMRTMLGQGQGIASQAQPAFMNAMNFSAPQVTAAGLNNDIQGLLNPYTQNVVDTTNNEIRRQSTINQQANDAKAVASGAGLNDRSGVVAGMNNRDTMDAITRNTATLMSQGYDMATATAKAIQQGNQSAAISGAGINLQGGQGMSGLAQIMQSLNMGDINGLLTTGNVEQQNRQAQDTFNYGEYQNQYKSAFDRLNAMVSATGSAPHDTTTNGTQTQEVHSNALGPILGLGLGLASLPMGGGMSLGGGLLSSMLGGGGGGAPSYTSFGTGAGAWPMFK